MRDEVASRFTGICREGDEDVGWRDDEPSPLSAPSVSGEASSSLSGTGESSLSGVSGRDGGGFSAAGSCWGLEGGSEDASWGRDDGAGAVVVFDAVAEVDAPSASPSRRGELGGGESDDCGGLGDVFCVALLGEKGETIEGDGTEGEPSVLRARGSVSLETVGIGFHEKWSLLWRVSG